MFRKPSTAEVDFDDPAVKFFVLKPGMYNGVQCKRGDELPDTLTREKVEQLVRIRYAEAKIPDIPKKKSEPAAKVEKKVKREETTKDLSALTLSQLRKLCKNRGLATYGTKEDLRKRLRH